MMTATLVQENIIQELLAIAEFSLITSSLGEVQGRLRFPPGCNRLAIRELVQDLERIVSQRCFANEEGILSHWSEITFEANLQVYQELYDNCLRSNFKRQRELTEELLQTEENAELKPNSVENNIKEIESQLKAMTLSELKKLAKQYEIEGRSALTRNLTIAKEKLIPKLMPLLAFE